MIVSAGAGTGKTYVLVNKYLDLLTQYGAGSPHPSGRISVLNILALTFTDKAASEMKERLRTGLGGREGAFWERARREFLVAPVQTFHSFCAGVLREFAFDAGLEPSFGVIDERESTRILTQALEDLIHTPRHDEKIRPLVTVLSLTGSHTLEKMLRSLYAHRDEADQFFWRLENQEEELISRWQDEICRFREEQVSSFRTSPGFSRLIRSLTAFSQVKIAAGDKVMDSLLALLPHLEEMERAGSADQFFAAADRFLGIRFPGGKNTNWPPEILEELRTDRRTLTDLIKKEIHPFSKLAFSPEHPFGALELRFLHDLGEVFSRYCTRVDEEKTRSGGLDFTDLIRHTRRLFRTNPDVARYYRDRFEYILIDEFQDTDPAQFEIITTIIGAPSPKTRGLFIVGDPKQSIYLFRDADVTRFREAWDLITGPCAGTAIPLDVCFRSSPDVVRFVNILFSRIFRDPHRAWEFAYDPLEVCEDRRDHEGTISLMLISADSGSSEFDAVAIRIGEMVNSGIPVSVQGPRDEVNNRTFQTRPVSFGDIAILLEGRTHLGLLIHALGSRGIPYYIHKGSGFYARQEILDLISLLSVLCRPHDDIHLAGLLRSPYFGISDADLLRISRRPGQTFLEKLAHGASEDHSLLMVYTQLSGWIRKAGRVRLVPLIRSVLDESGILAVYGGMQDCAQIIANIEKFLTLVQGREEKGRYLLADLVTDLQDALIRDEDEGEAMIDDPDRNAVTIMTIHGSKGLEFPVVFVPELSGSPQMTREPILLDSSRDLMGIVLVNPEHEYERTKTPVYTILKQNLDERLLAEKKRLLYVALTRSSDHLVMSGTYNKDLPDGSKNTRLDWILSSLGISAHSLQQGWIDLQDESGAVVRVQIICPSLSEAGEKPGPDPVRLPEGIRSSPGLFSTPSRSATPPPRLSWPVTRVSAMIPDLPGYRMEPGEKGGVVLGSAIHDVLRGRAAQTVIDEFGISDPEQQALLRSVHTNFWSLPGLAGVRKIFREQAVTMPVFGFSLTGRIDLLVRLADGTWLVIDHKSDRVHADTLAQRRQYQFQVEIYRRAAMALVNGQVTGALYAVHENRLISLAPWTDEEVHAALQDAVTALEVKEGSLLLTP